MSDLTSEGPELAQLLADIRKVIERARANVAQTAKSELTMVYWHIGRRLLKDNLTQGRGDHGKRILATLSQELSWSQATRSSHNLAVCILIDH